MTTFFPLETRHQLITEKCWWENSTWNLFVVHSSVSHVRSKWFNQCNCYYFPNYTETFFPNLVEKVKVSSMSRFNFDLVLSKRFPDFSFSLHVLLCKICRYCVKFNRCRCVTYKSTNQCSLEKKKKEIRCEKLSFSQHRTNKSQRFIGKNTSDLNQTCWFAFMKTCRKLKNRHIWVITFNRRYDWVLSPRKMWLFARVNMRWIEIPHSRFNLFGRRSWPVYLHLLEVVKTDCYHGSKANQKCCNLSSHLDLGSSFSVFRAGRERKGKKMKFEPDEARWLTRLELFNTLPF